ncbi:MAG TPA: LysM peptidoglycan-binding domain-containing protein, partial [Gemmatimonadales bacterium]|nr:LysM peptidoglycan-binding domain-containing protein [Gemmatimonadales bacterium]
MTRRLLLPVMALLLASCAARAPAPVVDRVPPTAAPVPAPAADVAPPAPVEKPLPTHVVKRGETLVGIALAYGLDYRELAAWNNITNPNVLAVGQVLVVAAPASAQPYAGPVTTPLAMPPAPIEGRPLGNTPTLKVEPRGQKVPYSDRALAQLSAPGPGAPTPMPPTTPVPEATPAPP